MPDKEKNAIIEKADLIMKGLIDLPGLKELSYVGENLPKWQCLPEGNSDIEAVFVLNRHIHWESLVDAYRITGEKKYANRVYAELEDWIDTCPCPEIETGFCSVKGTFDTYTDISLACWRVLEAGFRMFRGWSRLPELFRAYGHVSDRLREKLLNSLEQHAEVLIKASPILHPEADHNHYLMENVGLFMIGYSFPELGIAKRCREIGAGEIKRCILTQFGAYGGQIEGCPYYHNEMLELLLMVLGKIKESRIVIEEEYRERISRALRYSVYATRPNGLVTAFGDSDALCLAGYKGVYAAVQTTEYRKYPLCFWEKDRGQFFIRSGWEASDANLAVICKIPVQNEHSHADAGSFEFTCYGKTMLVDPGRYTYQEGELRKKFKSAAYHNTLLINGKEPFAYIGTWEYGEQKKAYIEKADEEEITMYQLSYQPILHIRRIRPHFKGKVNYFTVVDEVENLHGESVEILFHLDYQQYQYLNNGIRCYDDKTACTILTDSKSSWRAEDGLISEHMDETRKTLRYIGKRENNYGTVVMETVIIASEGCPEENLPEDLPEKFVPRL